MSETPSEHSVSADGGAGSGRHGPRLAPGTLLPWAGLLGLALWTAAPGPLPLVVAAVGFAGAAILAPGGRVRTVGLALGLVAVLAGFLVEDRVRRVITEGEPLWETREAAIFERLQADLSELMDRSVATASTVADRIDSGNPPTAEALASLRSEGGLDGLAVFDPQGRLVIWDGEHRGRIPDAVRRGTAGWGYGDLPLASHFYFTAPLANGGTVMASTLLHSDLPPAIRAGTGDFARRFRDRTGGRITIARPERLGDRIPDFEMRWEGRTLFAVVLERPSDAERLAGVRTDGRRLGLLLLMGIWALLLAGTPGGAERTRVAAASIPLLAFLVPPEAVPGLSRLSRPGEFLLPGGISLGRVLLVTGAAAVVLALSPMGRLRRGPGRIGAALGVAVLLPLLIGAFRQGASLGLLAGPETGWVVWTLALSVVCALVVQVALGFGPRAELDGAAAAIAAASTLVLLGGAGIWAVHGPGLPAVAAALWALPVLLLYGRIPVAGARGGAFALVIAAGSIGTSAALPAAWGDRILARRAVAVTQLERLGTEVDPHLEFLLHRMGRGIDRLDAVGARPVELLYEGWRSSGLAEAGYPIWLTLWSPGGLPEEDLPVGTRIKARPGVADAFLDEVVRGDTISVRRFELADAHYVLEVPLRGGFVVTGVVPPLRSIGSASLLGPLFGAIEGPGGDPLTLVPLLPGEERVDEELTWVLSPTGWRGEVGLTYPGAFYHAHYEVGLPGPLVTVARAGLLLILSLGVLALLWGVGRSLRGLIFLRGPRWSGRLRSFQARVTIALFAFFAVSNLGFGTLAYRTISGASERAAEVLAERVAGDAEAIYYEVQGQLDFLAQRVGSELLEYREGALREGSLDPLVELGLYQGWLPYDVQRALDDREAVQAVRRTVVGEGAYVTAYRRLPDGDVVAAPVPLQAGRAAVRAREVVHLLAFAMLAGGILSLLLALLVGRALSRPIRTLRIASERVGSGNLRVRLPEDREDEFGRVFEAFNRMVRRLRRARRSLLRTTQRTRAIVEDSATGVIALDGEGRVTLINPRAQELLGEALEEESSIGEAIARTDDDGIRAVLRWIRSYQREGPLEAGSDLQLGGRRLRARGRRITREGPLEGVVVNLEDVTDELRAERILAWGEMARQVAHEVKNPLTPIKLAIQHIRRAFMDRRPDFEEILIRNADAMLNEIDRLAEIASSFSRFAAPGEAAAALEPVALAGVIDDVLTLYASPGGGVRFEGRVEDDLPLVRARATEVKEVLVNLLENARAAIPTRGLVTIHAFRANDGVRVAVVDDGAGIPDEILGRIFEPQFSTRSTGTGLGLAIVRRLVERWGGQITVRSRVGEGTAMQLSIPLWTEADDRSAEGSGGPSAGEGSRPDGGGPAEDADPTSDAVSRERRP